MNSTWGTGPQDCVPLKWDEKGSLSASYKGQYSVFVLPSCALGQDGAIAETRTHSRWVPRHRRQAGNGAGAWQHWQPQAHPKCCQSVSMASSEAAGQAKPRKSNFPCLWNPGTAVMTEQGKNEWVQLCHCQ